MGSEGAEQRDELADLIGGREVRRRVAEGAAAREFHPRDEQRVLGHAGPEHVDLQHDRAVET